MTLAAVAQRSGADIRLRTEVEPLPGWFARHRQTLRPARQVMNEVPRGVAKAGPAGAELAAPVKRQAEDRKDV